MRSVASILFAIALAGCGAATPATRTAPTARGIDTSCACGKDGVDPSADGYELAYSVLGERVNDRDYGRLVAAYGPELDATLAKLVLADANWQTYRDSVDSLVELSRTTAEAEARSAIEDARPEIVETLRLTRDRLRDATKEGRFELAIELRTEWWHAYEDSATKLTPLVIAHVVSKMPKPSEKTVDQLLESIAFPIGDKLAARPNLEPWQLRDMAITVLGKSAPHVERTATTKAVARIVEPIVAEERRSWLKIMK